MKEPRLERMAAQREDRIAPDIWDGDTPYLPARNRGGEVRTRPFAPKLLRLALRPNRADSWS